MRELSDRPAANPAAVAVDDSATLPVKEAISIDVLANDTDPDGDRLTVIQATPGIQGRVQINADGSVLYTPGQELQGRRQLQLYHQRW